MSSRRALKVAEAIREVVSMAILTEIRDPRVVDVTVTHVTVTGDLRLARVHVSVMGDDKKQKLCLQGLQHSTGFLQRKVGDRLEMKFTPQLAFELDQGVKNSANVARILREVLPPQPLDPESETAEAWDADERTGDT
jgi:ribosome-binding factor A